MMKKMLFLMTFLAVSCIYAENLCKNGDFEEGTAGWVVPDWGNVKRVKPVIETGDLPDAGQKALRFNIEPGKETSVYQNVRIPDSAAGIRFSVQTRTKFPQRAWVQASVYMKKGREKCQISFSTKAGLRETPWETFTGKTALPEGKNRSVRVYLSVAKKAVSGYALFDNVIVEPLSKEELAAKETEKTGDDWKNYPVTGTNLLRTLTAEWGTDIQKQGETWILTPNKGKKVSALFTCTSLMYQVSGPHCLRFTANHPVTAKLVIRPVYGKKAKTLTFTVPAVKEKRTDGKIRYELRWNAPETAGYCNFSFASSGKTVMENLELKRMIGLKKTDPVALYQVIPGGNEGLLLPGEPAWIDLDFINSSDQPQTVSLSGQVDGYFGEKESSFEQKAELAPRKISRTRISFPDCKALGFHAVNLTWKNGKKSFRYCTSIVRVDAVPEKPDRMFGMSCFCGGTGIITESMRRIGVGTRGVRFAWTECENPDGSLSVGLQNALVADNEKAGIATVGMISVAFHNKEVKRYSKLLARKKAGEFPWDDAYFEDYGKFGEKLAKYYGKRISHWALSGEINLLIRRDARQREYFIRATRALAKGIRRAQPDAVIAGISCSGADGREFPRYSVTAGLWEELHDVLDGVSPDQYAVSSFGPGRLHDTSLEDQLPEKMSVLRNILKKHGKSFISIDERGPRILCTLPVDSPYDRSLANIEAQHHVVMKSIPDFAFNLYFRWRPWREGEMEEYSVCRKEAPRRVLASYANTARRLNQAKIVSVHPLSKDVPCYFFKRGDKTVAALWYCSKNPADTVSMTLAGLPEGTLYDVQGRTFQPKKTAKGIALVLGEAPVFFETDLAPEKLSALFDKADLTIPEIKGNVIASGSDTREALIENLTNSDLKLTLSLDNGKSWSLDVPKNSIRRSPFRIGKGAEQLHILSPRGALYHLPVPEAPVPVYAVKSMAELEKDKACIVLNSLTHINDVDCAANGLWTGEKDLSAEIRLGYNAENLFLSIAVKDDVHSNRNSGHYLWKGDSVQFALDPNHDAMLKRMQGKQGLYDDDWLLTAGLGTAGGELYCYNASDPALAEKKFPVKPEILRNDRTGVTRYRIALPWTVLKGFRPEPGKVFGFNAVVMDSDKGRIDCWMQISQGITNGAAPEKFRSFILMK